MSKKSPRYRVSKSAIHLNVGWHWPIWDTKDQDFVDSLLFPGRVVSFDSRDRAEEMAHELNGAS
jgi:hypothetical protein